MAEIVIWTAPTGTQLTLDTDDIEAFETPRDVIHLGDNNRALGAAHLNITFKPGKSAVWKEPARSEQ
jgi:hypothetical protein